MPSHLIPPAAMLVQEARTCDCRPKIEVCNSFAAITHGNESLNEECFSISSAVFANIQRDFVPGEAEMKRSALKGILQLSVIGVVIDDLIRLTLDLVSSPVDCWEEP